MTEAKHTPEDFENIISRFKDGHERFEKSATMNKVVNCLMRGYDHYKLMDELIYQSDTSSLLIEQLSLNKPPIPMMISKDVADQLLLSRVSDLEKEVADLEINLSTVEKANEELTKLIRELEYNWILPGSYYWGSTTSEKVDKLLTAPKGE